MKNFIYLLVFMFISTVIASTTNVLSFITDSQWLSSPTTVDQVIEEPVEPLDDIRADVLNAKFNGLHKKILDLEQDWSIPFVRDFSNDYGLNKYEQNSTAIFFDGRETNENSGIVLEAFVADEAPAYGPYGYSASASSPPAQADSEYYALQFNLAGLESNSPDAKLTIDHPANNYEIYVVAEIPDYTAPLNIMNEIVLDNGTRTFVDFIQLDGSENLGTNLYSGILQGKNFSANSNPSYLRFSHDYTASAPQIKILRIEIRTY